MVRQELKGGMRVRVRGRWAVKGRWEVLGAGDSALEPCVQLQD